MCRPWSDKCTDQPVDVLQASFIPSSLRFPTFPPFSTLIHLLPALVFSLNIPCLVQSQVALRRPIRNLTPLQAVTPPVCRVIQRAAPVDPSGEWHFWAHRADGSLRQSGEELGQGTLGTYQVIGVPSPIIVLHSFVLMEISL